MGQSLPKLAQKVCMGVFWIHGAYTDETSAAAFDCSNWRGHYGKMEQLLPPDLYLFKHYEPRKRTLRNRASAIHFFAAKLLSIAVMTYIYVYHL